MSPRTTEQFREIREGKTTLIMESALEQFANEGYYRTTISQIARQAGISKGLMYNYFESKEALLQAIVEKSVSEANQFFDINRDGILTEEEFEYFVRKVPVLLKKKQSFWRLLMQMLVQKDVRQQLTRVFGQNGSGHSKAKDQEAGLTPRQMKVIIANYFLAKKEKRGKDYDPICEFHLFIWTLLGFAVQSIYSNEKTTRKAIDRIIELYK